MLKKHGGKIAMALIALLVGGFLVFGTVPAFAAAFGNGNGQGLCSGLGVGRNGGSLAATVTDILGISRNDLAVARQAGKSLNDIAVEKGVGQEQLLNDVLAKRQQNLAQALQDQKITQDQYNQCVQQMKENIEKNLARTATGPNGTGNGSKMGRGQGQGNGPQNGRGAGNCSGVNCNGICQR
ncbi:MAG: hypothetical protein ABRQ26_10015 [Syntrophomonadaceae bacterium]